MLFNELKIPWLSSMTWEILQEVTVEHSNLGPKAKRKEKEDKRSQLKNRLKCKQKQKPAMVIWNSVTYYCWKECDKKECLHCQWSRTNDARPRTVKSRIKKRSRGASGKRDIVFTGFL